MKEIEIEKIVQTNQRLLLILGYAVGFIQNVPLSTSKDQLQYEWLIKAIENGVYLDKPLPPMP